MEFHATVAGAAGVRTARVFGSAGERACLHRPGSAMKLELRFTGIGRNGWQDAFSVPASFESSGIE